MSLEAYNQFICGWVSDVCSREVNCDIVVTARVKFNRLDTTDECVVLHASPALSSWLAYDTDLSVIDEWIRENMTGL